MNSFSAHFITRVFFVALSFVFVGMTFPVGTQIANATATFQVPRPQLEAKAAILLEADSGRVLFSKNANQRIYPASLTKLMTLYIIFDQLKKHNLSLDQTVTIGKHAYKVGNSTTGSSTMFLLPGQSVTVENLIHGIATDSGNDASVAMAEYIAGSEKQFAEYMNLYAEKLGLKGSHFVNSTGWPNNAHYSTAADIAKLSRHIIIDFPEYYHYLSVKSFTYNKIKQYNRNTLLFDDSLGVDGLKTGHTTQAGFSLAFSAVKNGIRLIGMVDGLPSIAKRASQGKKLLHWAQFNIGTKIIYKKGQLIKKIPVWKAKESSLSIIAPKDIILFYPKMSVNGAQNYQLQLKTFNILLPPVHVGDLVGTITIVNKTDPSDTYSYNLYSSRDIEKAGKVSNFFEAPYWFFKKLFL